MTGTNSTGTYMRQWGTAVELRAVSMTILLLLLVLINLIDETDAGAGGGRTDPLTKIRY